MSYIANAKVINIIKHKENINEYEMKLDKKRNYSAGAFVQLSLDRVTASDIWPESRTFSIASYKQGSMRFIIKNVGAYTNRIFNELTIGKNCTIKYPFGDLFDIKTIDEKHIFVAGGVGVTPFLGLVECFKSRDKIENVDLFYSVKAESDLLHLKELEENLNKRLNIFVTGIKSADYINRRMDIHDLEMAINGNFDTNFYICGPKSFNNEIKSKLCSNGYTKIHMDEWE